MFIGYSPGHNKTAKFHKCFLPQVQVHPLLPTLGHRLVPGEEEASGGGEEEEARLQLQGLQLQLEELHLLPGLQGQPSQVHDGEEEGRTTETTGGEEADEAWPLGWERGD